MAFAKATIVGNIGRDAELRYTPQGIAVCQFSVAVSERGNEDTTWYKCSLWRERGEKLHEWLKKGKQVYVEGKLKFEAYMDKEGKPQAAPVIDVNVIELLGGRAESADAEPQAAAFAAQAPSGPRKVASKQPVDEFKGGGGVEDDSGIPF